MAKPKTEFKLYLPDGSFQIKPIGDLQAHVRAGDASLCGGPGPISKVIVLFTRKYIPTGEWCPSHVEIAYENLPGVGWVNFSAESRGYIPRPLLRHAAKGHDVQIWRKSGLSTQKKARIKRETLALATRDKGYGLNEAVRIGLPFLPTTRNLTHMCSEAFCRVYRRANMDLFPGQDLEKVPPSMVLAKIMQLAERDEWYLVAEF